jgi:hypothetical protein
MWFKTRVGYYSVSEPMEIRVAKYEKGKPPSFSLFARSLSDVSIDYIGIIGKLKASGRSVHLAQFVISEASVSRIAECMKTIEEAIASEAKFCDLSAVGDEAAWGDGWTLIKW